MDILALIKALIANARIPKVTSSDAGKVMAVGNDGNWTAGSVTNATITVTDHTLTVINS